ncbi:MAG: DJ-1/PfpI family protein [Candidatus Edwardsbacteria bacterium]|nr:DJ-1/PfpI family protein [Candidatus Edwardsbacteria bacterium]
MVNRTKRLIACLAALFWLTGAARGDYRILALYSGNYGPNSYYTKDDMARYGWRVTTAALTKTVSRCPYASYIPATTVDTLISDISGMEDFDALAIMPASWRSGASYTDLLNDSTTLRLIRAADSSSKTIWAPCAAVRVLAKAGVISGHRVVGASAYQSEYLGAGATYLGDDHPPVVDGNIVTCVRNQFYHVKNCEALALALESQLANTKVSNSSKNSFSVTPVAMAGTLWAWAIGGTGSEGATALVPTGGGGFGLTGFVYPDGGGTPDIFLAKVDSGGSLLWAKTYGGTGWECAYGMAETPDSGFIIAGYTTSAGAGSRDIWLIRTNSLGDTLWTKTIGDSLVEVGRSIALSPDGGFVVGGHTDSRGAGEDELFLVKTDSLGDTLWTRIFGGSRSDMGRSLLPLADGYALTGATGSPELTTNNQDYYLVRTDASGQQTWAKGYGTNGTLPFDWANHITRAGDGGYLLVGESSYNAPLNICAVRTDSLGTMKWRKFYGYSSYDYGNGSCPNDSGGFMICGTSKSGTPLQNDFFLVMTDSLGSQRWSLTLGGPGHDWASVVCRDQDGNYVIGGQSDSYGSGSYDILLLKIGRSGPSGIDEESPAMVPGKAMIKAYPNPFTSNAGIEYQTDATSRVDLGIYNVAGQKICQLYQGAIAAGWHHAQWDGLDRSGKRVSSGVYLCRLSTPKGQSWLKLVKLP